MKKIKMLAFFLILALMASAAVSCAKSESGSDSGKPADGDSGNSGGEDSAGPEQPSENAKLEPDVPAADYGGYEFTILVSVNAVTGAAVWNDFEAEEENGDVINDAIYKRNAYVEEKYNIQIKNIEMEAVDGMDRPAAQKLIKNSIAAGDNTYDASMLAGYATCNMASGGFLVDMNNMAPLDLSKPWWDQKANRDLMINNKMFYTSGDISNVVNEATYAILFNKKLIKDHGFEQPYDLVRRGEWTYDKLAEMGAQIGSDLNGDGKMGFDDLYGALVWDDTMMGTVNSIGERCAKINGSGEIELTLRSERVLKSFDTYINFVLDKDHAFMYQREDWGGEKTNAMFENNQGLFYIQIMELVVRLRAMEVDFGVIPYPKLETSQENYYSTVSSWHSGFMCVPVAQEDISRTGALLEAMAAESMYTMRPAYYDIALKGKYIRDEESEEMLDLIFDSKIYDLGWLYQIGGYNEEIMNLYRNRKTDFISMYEKREEKAYKDIAKINEAFDEILN
ncbi:MAG: extracellular solute-binding protein [Oscillospiraceae bacterium]|nr:extracellular solute-binding protein [Oscillospiraceae bacterium]